LSSAGADAAKARTRAAADSGAKQRNMRDSLFIREHNGQSLSLPDEDEPARRGDCNGGATGAHPGATFSGTRLPLGWMTTSISCPRLWLARMLMYPSRPLTGEPPNSTTRSPALIPPLAAGPPSVTPPTRTPALSSV